MKGKVSATPALYILSIKFAISVGLCWQVWHQVILWFLPHTSGCSEVIFLSQTVLVLIPHSDMDHLVSDLPQLWLLSLCTQFCVSNMYIFHDTEWTSHFLFISLAKTSLPSQVFIANQFSFCLHVVAVGQTNHLVQGLLVQNVLSKRLNYKR